MNNIIVGLTGQTGAGKSTVSGFLREQGCNIINADLVAREALAVGSDVLKRLALIFGSDIIDKDGSCRRRLLAQRAFSSEENTEILNKITHPWIKARIEEYIEMYKKSNDSVIVIDAPQLFESGCDSVCDKVIAVIAPQSIRLERIIRRDSLSISEAQLRINAQHSQEYYTRKSDFIIDGSLPLEEVRSVIAGLIRELSALRGV